MTKPRLTPEDVALRLIGSKIARSDPRDQTVWPAGRLPDQAFVVADGLATRSTPERGYRPWLRRLQPTLRSVSPYAAARGFSYSAPGHHYSALHTDISLLESSDMLVAPYAPHALPTTYLAFSLAAPLFALGLAAWIQGGQATERSSLIRQLVLVQPASVLHQSVIQALERARFIPAAVDELSDPDAAVLARVVAALAELTPTIPVTMIYWPGDGFLDYDASLIDHVKAIGVIPRRVEELAFPEAMGNPFIQHAAVVSQRKIRNEIRGALVGRQLSRNQEAAG